MKNSFFILSSLCSLVLGQQNGPFYVNQLIGADSGLAKAPGAIDDRYLIFPTFTHGSHELIPGQVFDAYVEVHGDVPEATPNLSIQYEGSNTWISISSLAPADGKVPNFINRNWTFSYVDPDFSKFNTTTINYLASVTTNAYGYWFKRIAINRVGTHTVRLICGNDVRTGNWYVVAPKKRTAKNVILFIGDGLNIPIVTATRTVSRGFTGGFPNSPLHLEEADKVGTLATSGIDSIMTDSANSAYAYASGHKSMMNALGVYADTNTNDMDDPKVELITERIRRDYPGMAIGVVTTSEIQDATPAAWWAHTRRRSNKAEITYQMLYGQDNYGPVIPDVIFGGGGRYFNGSDLTNTRIPGLAGRNLWTEATALGYEIVMDRSSMKAQSYNDKPVIGIWHYGNEDVWLDRHIYTQNLVASNYPVKFSTGDAPLYRRVPNDQPDLAEQVEAALRILTKRGGDNGFFLMVEGASIDKQEHPMDFDRAIGEMIDFDNAIGVAKSFSALHHDTLLLVTSDHAQGYDVYGTVDTLAFNACNKADGSDFTVDEYVTAEACKIKAVLTYDGAGFPDYVDANKDNFPDNWTPRRTLAQSKVDHPYIYREDFQVNNKTRTPDASGILSSSSSSSSSTTGEDKFGLRLQGMNDPSQTGGDTAHTLADIPLYGSGPGSEMIRVYQQNIHVHTIMANALGLGSNVATYRNDDSTRNVNDITCTANMVDTLVKHATLGLLTTVCPNGSKYCDTMHPIAIGSTTYYKVFASMDELHLTTATECMV